MRPAEVPPMEMSKKTQVYDVRAALRRAQNGRAQEKRADDSGHEAVQRSTRSCGCGHTAALTRQAGSLWAGDGAGGAGVAAGVQGAAAAGVSGSARVGAGGRGCAGAPVGVGAKAGELASLVQDSEALRLARRQARAVRERYVGGGCSGVGVSGDEVHGADVSRRATYSEDVSGERVFGDTRGVFEVYDEFAEGEGGGVGDLLETEEQGGSDGEFAEFQRAEVVEERGGEGDVFGGLWTLARGAGCPGAQSAV
ncbi:hypothetical protein PMAC_000692 [Pneumocystis sp. 'macacae']|nr:hypothetical protein PMAC_000692 [Pneumocystis sp. 'macacae']